MTRRGYDSLIAVLNKRGNDFPLNPDILVTPAMLSAAEQVLNAKQDINPYEKHFRKEPSPQSKKELEKINLFLKSLIDRLNRHEDYDIEKLASAAGIDVKFAEQLAESVIKKISDNSWKK